jgi:hypothetical protein
VCGGFLVLETVKHVGNVLGHRNVHVFFRVIPTNSESVEERAVPVFGDGVQVLKGAEQVHSVLAADVLDAKIVDDEGEIDRASVVCPQ